MINEKRYKSQNSNGIQSQPVYYYYYVNLLMFKELSFLTCVYNGKYYNILDLYVHTHCAYTHMQCIRKETYCALCCVRAVVNTNQQTSARL